MFCPDYDTLLTVLENANNIQGINTNIFTKINIEMIATYIMLLIFFPIHRKKY